MRSQINDAGIIRHFGRSTAIEVTLNTNRPLSIYQTVLSIPLELTFKTVLYVPRSHC